MANFIKTTAIASLALILFGCVTSAQFQIGAKQLIPDITAEARVYVNSDQSTSVDKSARLTQLAALDADVANQNSINRLKVTGDWKAVEPWYLVYVDQDVNLDSTEKALRHDACTRFDKLIVDDGNRPFAKLATPTTKP